MISATMAVVNFTSHQAPLLQFGATFLWEVIDDRDVVGPKQILKMLEMDLPRVSIQFWVP